MNTKINPLVLLFINLIIPFTAIFSYNLVMNFYLFGYGAVLLILFGKFRRLLKFVAAYIFCGSVYYFLLTHPFPYSHAVTMTFFIWFHFMPIGIIASLLFYDYSPSEILSALQLLRLNRKFMIALTIALRYIPTFQAEFKLMKSSMAMRGIAFTWKRPLRSFSYFITPQLFRCSLLAEELTAAGITKGIEHNANRTSVVATHWRMQDSISLFAFVFGFLSIALLGGKL